MPQEAIQLDRRRYRKVRRFTLRTLLHALWWDLICGRWPLSYLRPDPIPRWSRIARRYRALAEDLGGVLIKLGQFLSSRVDVLPIEVTRELAGLQDAVPPEPVDTIVAQVEADFECPLDEIFEHFSTHPVGSASLAQVHGARLAGGGEVVVKVLRPGIEVLVDTDLAATDLALRWLRMWKPLGRRVDLDRLAREFRETTVRELDLTAEAASLRRFAELFEDDDTVAVPEVFIEASGRRTLTMENVAFIKIADRVGLEAAGIDPARVAGTVYRAYMRQVFVHNLVHADPHPGNLFVEPLPTAEERAAGIESFAPGSRPAYSRDRDFRLVFVDFGMMAVVPERLRGAMRDYLIALGSRDAARLVRSYVKAGVLLPGADLEGLEQVYESLFDRFWGVRMGQLRDVALSEARFFFREYRELILKTPFQVPVDLLFTGRAIGLLAGLATRLDPDFDPWAETVPFAERMAAEEVAAGWKEGLAELVRAARDAVELPSRLRSVLDQAESGKLTLETSLDRASRSTVERLERAGRRLAWVVTGAAFLIVGTQLHLAGSKLGPWALGLAFLAFFVGWVRGR